MKYQSLLLAVNFGFCFYAMDLNDPINPTTVQDFYGQSVSPLIVSPKKLDSQDLRRYVGRRSVEKNRKVEENKKNAKYIIAKLQKELFLEPGDFQKIIEATNHLPYKKRIDELDRFYNILAFGQFRNNNGCQVSSSDVIAPLKKAIDAFKKSL